MPLLSKWTACNSRWETDEKPRRTILFPLYNKAFKLLADSNIHLCLSAAAGGAGEERVIDGPRETSFRAEAGSEKAAVWVVTDCLQTACFPFVLDWLLIHCPHRIVSLSLGVQHLQTPAPNKNASSHNRLLRLLCLCMHLYASVCFCLCTCLRNWLGISEPIQERLTSDLLNK